MATGGLWIAVIGGVIGLIVSIASWIALNLIGKPYLEYRQLRAEIARCLIFYANVRSLNMAEALPQRTEEAMTKYRELASDVVKCAESIPFYRAWALLRVLPKQDELEKVKGYLIGLSNSICYPNQGLEISQRMDGIRRILGIKNC